MLLAKNPGVSEFYTSLAYPPGTAVNKLNQNAKKKRNKKEIIFTVHGH
jgi:hypothetical protein